MTSSRRWDWSENWISTADRCQGITGCETENETVLPIPVDPNVAAFDSAANAIQARQFVMRGGTMTAATTPVIASGSYAGDSDTAITVSFTVDSSGSMCSTTCAVAIWFGAHVSAQYDWGLGNGAGAIPGSPYHVALDAIDGASVGQRDNSDAGRRGHPQRHDRDRQGRSAERRSRLQLQSYQRRHREPELLAGRRC